jgi:hypothetical protein
MQVLSLMKTRVHRRAVETAQVTRVAELENSKLAMENSKLLVELEQAHAALAVADATQNSLSLTQGKLDEECAGLHTVVESLGQEKARAEAAREAECKGFHDYCIHHRKKLREVQINLEKEMNEIGGWCLPYPGKGSTIDEIVEWFDKEIWALLGAITKANKNFLCYCLVGVLRMLYENADCDHLDWLEAIMNSYDASFLNGRPDEMAKLLGCIVVFAWFTLCHGYFPRCAGGKIIRYVLRCLCIVDTNCCSLNFDIGREC